MPNYQRPSLADGTYPITQITHQQHPWLYSDLARHTLRAAINTLDTTTPFAIKLENRG